jgi:hypothetical protein
MTCSAFLQGDAAAAPFPDPAQLEPIAGILMARGLLMEASTQQNH